MLIFQLFPGVVSTSTVPASAKQQLRRTRTAEAVIYANLDLMVGVDRSQGLLLGRGVHADGYYSIMFNYPASLGKFIDNKKDDPAPGVTRLRNVDATGFDIKFNEWNYLEGTHPEKTVSYMVIEKGRYTLPDGSMVEAGSFAGTTKFATVAFKPSFAKAPVVMTTIASTNEIDTISSRLKSIGTTGFAYYFREQEKNTNTHVNETVNYIAWEPGEGSLRFMQYRVVNTGNAVTLA